MEFLPFIIAAVIAIIRFLARAKLENKQSRPSAPRPEPTLPPLAFFDGGDEEQQPSLESAPPQPSTVFAAPAMPYTAQGTLRTSADDSTGVAERPYGMAQRRRHSASALHISRTLSTAKGMAQAVVMAEILQGRGGKGARAWRR